MESMYIGNKALSEFSAKLLDWKPGAPNLTNTISPGKNYSFPFLLHSEIAPKALTVTVNVIGSDYADAMRRSSELILAVNDTVELYMPDGFYYRSALSGISDFSWPTSWIAEFTLTFQSVQHSDLIKVDIPRSPYTLYYGGTAPAGMKMEFTASSTLTSFTICGITLTNIPAGAKIVIDGLEKSVTQNGANKFAETDLIDFPAFDPQNPKYTIEMSQFIPAKISFYPTFM